MIWKFNNWWLYVVIVLVLVASHTHFLEYIPICSFSANHSPWQLIKTSSNVFRTHMSLDSIDIYQSVMRLSTDIAVLTWDRGISCTREDGGHCQSLWLIADGMTLKCSTTFWTICPHHNIPIARLRWPSESLDITWLSVSYNLFTIPGCTSTFEKIFM